jgi:Ca2+/Na+ antiporter
VKITKEKAVMIETAITSTGLFIFFFLLGLDPSLEMYIAMVTTYLAARLIVPKITNKFVEENEINEKKEE